MKKKEIVMEQLRFIISSTMVYLTDLNDGDKKKTEEMIMEKYDDYYEWLNEE